MKNDKKKNIIIGLLIAIIVGLVIIIVFTLGTKYAHNNDADDNGDNSQSNAYKFGEEVILNSLLSVDMGIEMEEDFSKWNVLSDEGEYVTLYSSNVFAKISNVSESKFEDVLSKYNIDLGAKGEVRGLNENDLKLLGCDLTSKKCSNVPDWAQYSLTEVTDGNNLVIFYGSTDGGDDSTILEVVANNDDVLIYYRPVIKILKSNINKTLENDNINKSYDEADFIRQTKITLVDEPLCTGNSSSLIATIEENGNISISQSGGAALVTPGSAKYLYKVGKLACDAVSLYYITEDNSLYVLDNPKSDANQTATEVINSKVVEFLGDEFSEEVEDGYNHYFKVLLENGEVENINYLKTVK